MISMFAGHAVKQAGKTGMEAVTSHGAWGLAGGLAWGAVSDNETVVSGAFKGAVLGGGAGAGMKALGVKMISGYNARAAQLHGMGVFDTANGAVASQFGALNSSNANLIGDAADLVARGKIASRFAKGASGDAYDNLAAGTLSDGWFSKKFTVDSTLQGHFKSFHTDFGDQFKKLNNGQKALLTGGAFNPNKKGYDPWGAGDKDKWDSFNKNFATALDDALSNKYIYTAPTT